MAQKDYSKFINTKSEYTKGDLLKRVLLEYQSIIDVFMKSNANIMAEHQAKWNHEIHLEKSKKASVIRNYKPLFDQKIAAMKKYIKKHLGKSFIWPSYLAAASSILLIRKPGRGLRFCINYWALNAVIIKNKYPIPLISETLEKLTGAVKYTKLDVIHPFNRIRIKEDHKWLTAFNSRHS